MAKTTANIGDIVRLFTPHEYKFIGAIEYIKVTKIENRRYYGIPVTSNGVCIGGTMCEDTLLVCIPGVNKWTDVIRKG